MMLQRISILWTALLIITQPLTAQAEMHGGRFSGGAPGGFSGGNRGGFSGSARAGASRRSFSAPTRSTNFQNSSGVRSNFHQGGFDFTGEIHNSNQREIQRQTIYRPMQNRPGATSSRTIAVRPVNFHGPPLPNHHMRGGSWSWNRGEIWHAAPGYWGGGFWGTLALADLGGAVLLGSLIDAQNQAVYQSYEVLPDTPGSALLADYGLTQTACGQPNLVIIWGPDNSLICTYPNGDIGPGNYTVDEANFTLHQQS